MKKQLNKIPSYLLLTLFSLISVYPIIWITLGSLKGSNEIYNNVWGLPKTLHFENYVNAWVTADLGGRISNSVLVTVSSLVILLFVATLAAYGFSRVQFPGRRQMYMLILSTILIPLQVVVIPLFLVVRDLGLLNTRLSLILTYTASGIAFSVFLLYGFLKTLPKDPEEAAIIDGANRFQVFFHVVLPLLRPGLATVAIFQGMTMWNEFFLALVLVRPPELQTIPVGMAQFFSQYQTDWSLYFAALATVTLPVIILFILMQRQFIAGLTSGAVKG